jgi:AraC-like DNA-binding protein
MVHIVSICGQTSCCRVNEKSTMDRARFRVAATLPEHAALIDCDRLVERSPGDAKAKIVEVRRGRFDLEGPRGVWLIVPSHMVFIPADRPYIIRTEPGTQVAVVHLDPQRTPWHHEGCWVTAVPPLAHEMVQYALRWPATRDAAEPVAESFFRTLALLCRDWFSKERILWLPAGRSAEVARAIQHVMDNLEDASIEQAAVAACLTARTLRRRFKAETGMTWRRFVREARMTQAINLLGSGRMRVSEVALSVGFRSIGAFTHAFSAQFGRTPSDFARNHRGTALNGGGPASAPLQGHVARP